MREELTDIIEELADRLYVYGCACTAATEDGDCIQTDVYKSCRVCFAAEMRERLIKAVELEQRT